jgi:transcriptional regulator with XRE-family HTH domain
MENTIMKIRSLRKSKSYTQDYMASQMGMSQKQYSRLENGETPLHLDHLDKISEVLDVGIDYFISSGVQQENHQQVGGVANAADIIINQVNHFSENLADVLKNQNELLQVMNKMIHKN